MTAMDSNYSPARQYAIVLAGGMGTRLRNVISDIPKPMADIQSTPFLVYVLRYLIKQGISDVVLSVGYKHEAITGYFGDCFENLRIHYCIEDEPLGTGGAIRKALEQVETEHAFVLNGDTLAFLDYRLMRQSHIQAGTRLSMALKRMDDISRYGEVVMSGQRIAAFREKERSGPGLINVGVYLINSNLFNEFDLPRIFSFENDFLRPNLASLAPEVFITEGYFIDIGVPDDYFRAQTELSEQLNALE
jgi:D-glycero-alpha-D-manno-heptose 1-phosphate guanylyltransferase